MTGDPASRLVGPAEHRVANLRREVHERAQLGDLSRVEPLGVDSVQSVCLHPPHAVADVLEGVRQVEHTALAEEEVVVELRRKTFPELQGVLIDPRALVPQVVRADDGGVAGGIAAADPAALEHGDVGDPVLAGQVVGGREAVPAPADHDDLVGGPRLGVAPEEVGVDGGGAHSPVRTSLRSTPIPSISTSTTSPSRSGTFGSRNTPTPSGVPVRIRSPASSVIAFEM